MMFYFCFFVDCKQFWIRGIGAENLVHVVATPTLGLYKSPNLNDPTLFLTFLLLLFRMPSGCVSGFSDFFGLSFIFGHIEA